MGFIIVIMPRVSLLFSKRGKRKA